MAEITPVNFDYFDPFIKDAKKSNLVFSNSTQYFACFDNNNLVGLCGIVWYKDCVKFKNDYVIPKYRGKGYFKAMMDYRINLILQKNIRKIKACCTDMSLKEYMKRGGIIQKQYKTCTDIIIDL